MSAENKDRSAFMALLQKALPSFLLAGAVLILLVMAGTLTSDMNNKGETFDFIALVVVFMAALTLAAAVFKGLGLANSIEAFGLPTGSVRALLAIGVMILFVVFGMPMIVPPKNEPIRLQTLQPNPAQVDDIIKRLNDQGFKVLITDNGSAVAPLRPAKIDVYTTSQARSPDEVDFNKQMLTAIITLLTSVVSFYFGSRSSTEATRAATEGTGGTGALNDAATLDLNRKQLGERFAALEAEVSKVGKAIDDLRAAPVPTDTALAELRQVGLAKAAFTRQSIEARRDDLKRLLSAIETGIAGIAAAATDSEKQVQRAGVLEQLQLATTALATSEQAQVAYAAEVAALR